MAIITLTQGKETIVDDDMLEYLSQWKWHYNDGYVCRNIATENGQKKIRLHAFIMGTPCGMDTDHADGNKLDNRKCNLRICTRSENRKNSKMRKECASGYKGVHKVHNRWSAYIMINKNTCLGSFRTPEDAAHAYDEAARQYFGEFAVLNFPGGYHAT